MALTRFFGTKPHKEEEVSTVLAVEPQDTKKKEEEKESSASKPNADRIITITWGTGMPIDVIFNFIHKNFEEDGFQDALVSPELAYRDAKEKIIRNDLEMLFKRIILRYKQDIRQVTSRIDNARKAFAISSASDLEALQETYEEHLAEISEMQQMLEENDPKMMTMIDSYRRGFLKGIAASTENFINKDIKIKSNEGSK